MKEIKSQTFPFLKLPPEIRNEIYRYLLCMKHNKHLSKSEGFTVPLLWPNYKYRFYTSVLRTNRQIQHESKHLARHENPLILIRSETSFWMDVVCRNAGISCVNRGAQELGHLVLDVDLRWVNFSPHPTSASPQTFEYLICYDQLSPLFVSFGVDRSYLIACHLSGAENFFTFHTCLVTLVERHISAGLLIFNKAYFVAGLAKMIFNISVLGYPQNRYLTSTTLPMSTQQQLLEPFTMLSHAVECNINGPVSPVYKASIVEKICRQNRPLESSVQKILSLTAEGKDAFLESRFASAISKQISALKEIVLTFGRLYSNKVIPSGDFAGKTYDEMQNHLLWKLLSNTVAAHLKLHQWQDAYEWACYGTDEYNYAGHNPRDYAVVLFRKAFASNRLGEHDRARREYREGKKFADLHFTVAWEDGEMKNVRLAFECRRGAHYFERVLAEMTV